MKALMPECLTVFFISCNRVLRPALLLTAIMLSGAGAQLNIPAPKLYPPSIDSTIRDSLRQPPDCRKRLASFVGDAIFKDTAFSTLSTGLTDLHSKDLQKAKIRLQATAKACTTLAAATCDLIAEAELGAGHVDSALAWFRAAHEHYLPQRYQADLEKRISAVIDSNHIDTAAVHWAAPWYRPGVARVSLERQTIIDSLAGARSWTAFDSVAKTLLDSAAVPPDRKSVV
jgi:hypothetical protein